MDTGGHIPHRDKTVASRNSGLYIFIMGKMSHNGNKQKYGKQIKKSKYISKLEDIN